MVFVKCVLDRREVVVLSHGGRGVDQTDTVVFNPEGTAWAVADSETLFVFDLETGGSTLISGAGLVTKVLGWLPS